MDLRSVRRGPYAAGVEQGDDERQRQHHGFALIVAVWVIGFGIGSATHLYEVIAAGQDVYSNAPQPVRWFWLSLTLVDPVIIVLLLARRQAGIFLGLTVMIVDVTVNWSSAIFTPALAGPGLVTQPVFLLILLVTTRPLWRSVKAAKYRSEVSR